MKVSARNVFEGQISALIPGPINAEVTLTLPGGDQLVAVVTQASARDLGWQAELALGMRGVLRALGYNLVALPPFSGALADARLIVRATYGVTSGRQ